MEMLVQAIDTCGYTDKCKIAIDCAADQLIYVPPPPEEGEEAPVDAEDDATAAGPVLYDLDKYNTNQEALWGEPLDGEAMKEAYTAWTEKYPQVISIEDAFVRSDGSTTQAEFNAQFLPQVESEEDRLAREEAEAEAAKSKKKGKGKAKKEEPEEEEQGPVRDPVGGDKPVKLQLVGDTTVNSETDLLDAVRHQELNAVVLDIAKHPTVSNAIDFCRMSQQYGVSVIAAGYSKEGKSTGDTFAADFAVGLRVGQFKAGAPCRSQFVAHYNQLMRISAGERDDTGKPTPGPEYAGLSFRNAGMKTMDLIEMEAPELEFVEEEEAEA